MDNLLNKMVSSVSEAYYKIIDNEVREFIDTLDEKPNIEEHFKIVEKGGIRGLTTDTEIHFKGNKIITIEQEFREDGSFGFEAVRHYEEGGRK